MTEAGAPAWVSVHVHYQTGLDQLLTEAVHPLVRSLDEDGLHDGWFFLRYWDGGTHLRLRIRPGTPAAASRVRERACGQLEQFLREHPSPTVMHQEDYAQLAGRLAAGEAVDAFSPRLRANNSLVLEPYRPEYDRYPDGGPIEAVEEHFVTASRLALGQLLAGAPPERLTGLALSVVAATWFSVLTRASERGAWGRQLTAADDSSDLDDPYRRQAEALRTRIRQIAHAVDRRRTQPSAVSATTTVLGQWHTSIQRVVAAADRYQEQHGPLPGARAFGLPAAAPIPDPRLPMADICAHLMLNRLGLSIPAEQHVRRLAARAVADVFPGRE